MPDKNTRLYTIIHGAAIEAGSVGLATAQISCDRLVIGAVQIAMVIQIAAEFGEEMDKAGAMGVIQSSVGTIIGVEVFNGIIKYAPGLGNIANMVTASSVTELIGWNTVKYYESEEKNR